MGGKLLIILDTHIWIWANSAPHRLSEVVQEAFQLDDAEFGLSSMSVWETVPAAQRGRLETALHPEANARAWLVVNPIKVLPVTTEIAILSRTLEFKHADPADRFIAATAYHFDCRLATVDERLIALPWLKTLQ